VWERARQQVAVPPGLRAVITVSAELTLWTPFLLDWLVWMRRSAPQLALRTQVGLPDALMDQVAGGVIDIAVLYTPQHRPGLKIEKLMEEKLVLVASPGDERKSAADYVYVDWGPEFAAHHNLSFPELANAGTYVGLGPLGLQLILKTGGSGYFRLHAVAPYLRRRRLRQVRGAPEFLYPVYAVYSENADPKIIEPALAGLRHVGAAQQPVARIRRRKGRKPA
jgi:DNA-binding transcriptional LysR family regulator